MNRLEFNEVMKAVKLPFNRLNNIQIQFGGTDYAIIEGFVPLVVANDIYQKYPENPYGIRINGGCKDWKPSEHIVNSYHIDTKEGLVIFITEMKDYFARKNNLKETEVKKFPELMARIDKEILKKINPTISTYEWMQSDEENSEIFYRTISNETPFEKEFRRVIDMFDQTVNPFINKDLELDEIKNYIQKVNISGTIYDSEYLKKRKNCCHMYIRNLENKNYVSYHRNSDGFLYYLHYELGEEQYLTVSHSYSTDESDEHKTGEVICIDYFGDNVEQKIDIRYNITKGVVGPTYEEKKPINDEQKKFIYNELLKAIDLAASITIDNMAKKGSSKQIETNNQ